MTELADVEFAIECAPEDAEPARTLASEIKKTAHLAWPVILAQLAIVGMNLVDTILAGRISSQILAEVAIGSAIWGTSLLWIIGTMMAVSPEVSGLRGKSLASSDTAKMTLASSDTAKMTLASSDTAKMTLASSDTAKMTLASSDRASVTSNKLLANTLMQALYLGLLVLITVLVVAPLAPHLMRVLKVDATLIPGASAFLYGILWGAPALTWSMCLQKFCEGMGRTKPGLYVSVAGLVLLIPLCYALLDGHFGMPRLLAQGAGIATAIVMWFNALTMTIYVRVQFKSVGALRQWTLPDFKHIRALAAVGVPIAITILMEAGLFYAVLLLMSRFGKDWVAAHSVAINVASIAFMMPLGLANAVTVRAGFAHGRGDRAGERLAGVSGICLCLATQAISAVVMLLFALPIANLYLPHEPAVALVTAKLLFLAAIFQFPDGVQAISNGALRGLRDTRWPMILTSIAYWGLGFPLAHQLAFATKFGPTGLWYGFILGLSAAAVFLTVRFFRLTRVSPHRRHGD
jgi:multidrug resistance protein, MATE family